MQEPHCDSMSVAVNDYWAKYFIPFDGDAVKSKLVSVEVLVGTEGGPNPSAWLEVAHIAGTNDIWDAPMIPYSRIDTCSCDTWPASPVSQFETTTQTVKDAEVLCQSFSH